MKPENSWIKDWRMGVDSAREVAVATELLAFFIESWHALDMEHKSKTTQNRYAGAMHALGGYLVEQAISDEGRNKTADELLSKALETDEGPLIFHDHETWQSELDTVCRKLHRYRKTIL